MKIDFKMPQDIIFLSPPWQMDRGVQQKEDLSSGTASLLICVTLGLSPLWASLF